MSFPRGLREASHRVLTVRLRQVIASSIRTSVSWIAALLLVAPLVSAQTTDSAVSGLSEEMQAWVNRSCPRSLGPSLWTSCSQREAAAARKGLPDLSALNQSDRAWANRTCPASLGPSLTAACLSRELVALQRMPQLHGLSPENKAWVLRTCPQSLGPSLFRSCAERESRSASTASIVPSQPSAHTPAVRTGSVVRTPSFATRSRSGRRANSYEIESSHNDEVFIINGEKFEAMTYCFHMDEGDEVVFLDGSPSGACATATLLNLRTREKCEVWCE